MTLSTLVKRYFQRVDLAVNWTQINPVLGKGEMGFETDTGLFKFGDGVSNYTARPYAGSGTSSFAGLTDATSALIATTNASVSSALSSKLSTTAGAVPLASFAPLASKTYMGRTSGGSGAVEAVPVATLRTDIGILDAVSIAYTTAVPLDSAAGKRMPQTVIATNTTLTLGPSPVTDGYCEMVIVGNGTNTITIPSTWSRIGSAPNMAASKRSFMAFTYLAIGEVLYNVTPLTDVAAALTFGTPAVANASPTVIVIPMSGTIGSIIPAVGDITLSGVSGVTVASVAAVGVNLNITVTPALTWQSAPSIAVASGKVGDVSNILSAASGTLAVTNNITMPVPGVPTTLTAGTPGATSMPLSWTAPAVNGTQGTVSDYVIEWRPAGSGGYSVFADGTNTTPSATVTGLTAGTSYDFRVKATNVTGAGAYSSVLTVSTASSRITFTDSFTGTNGATPDTRWTQIQSGWTIQSNQLAYNGGSYGSLVADCTAGDNAFQVDTTIIGGSNYAMLYIRYVDDNNYVAVQKRGDNSERYRLYALVSGSAVGAVDEASASSGTATLKIASVGNTITAYINGSSILSGTFTQFSTATKIGIGMNTSHATDVFDNAVLA